MLCRCSLPWVFVCSDSSSFLCFSEPQSGCSDLGFALENFPSGQGGNLADVVPPVSVSRCRLRAAGRAKSSEEIKGD